VPLTTPSFLLLFLRSINTNAFGGQNVEFFKCYSWCVSVDRTNETGQLPAPLSRPQTQC
jgi:hypothetical protein